MSDHPSMLDITDLGPEGLASVVDLALRPVGDLGRPLEGDGVALVFEKPSNRTRHSMEMAVSQLGGHPVYTRGEEVGLDSREPVEDVIRVLAGYHRIVAARVFDHGHLERMRAAAVTSVVNLLSDHSHPMQALADVLTMTREFGDLTGRVVAWVGDYNNVARSLAEVSLMSGMDVRLACPAGYDASDAELERLSLLGAGAISQSDASAGAVEGAHAVHTDTWVSMGQEDDAATRRAAFADYTVDAELFSLAADDAVFMHCMPAYRGLEVSADVFDGPRSRVITQAHDRMHAARGLLAHLVGVR
jgi:ornithine carbamoyltransferase